MLRLLWICAVRGRCPCCEEGDLFAGRFAFRERCRRCGLRFEQWYGDWITPTYVAGTAGLLVGTAATVLMIGLGVGLAGPVAPEWTVLAVSMGSAVAALRPSKAAYLAFLYRIGGVEVSAETRARLRWDDRTRELPERRRRAEAADARARRAGLQGRSVAAAPSDAPRTAAEAD